MEQTQPAQVINRKTLQENKENFEKLMNSRSFYFQGSEIYGGVGGLYDWGPPGCAIRTNIQQLWREHFILEEDMLEISTTCITPEIVFKHSGHIKKFADLVVRDSVNRRPERADKYLDLWIENLLEDQTKPKTEEQIKRLKQIQQDAEGYNKEEISAVYQELDIKSIDGNSFTPAEPFNLMFKTEIGPGGGQIGYLRPETAQGMFVNFNRLQQFNSGKIPFSAAQMGLGFRNEIAPRQQLMRVREFDMAEIEHFFDPENPSYPKFKYYKDKLIPLLSAKRQMEELAEEAVATNLGEAVSSGLICNETMGYFLIRTYEFLVAAGVNPNNIRFRQHKPKEMAHYAVDCWDAEIETSSGWVECVGHANRTCFDLECHAKGTGIPQLASRILKEPKKVKVVTINPDMGKLGKELQRKSQLNLYYKELSEKDRELLEQELKEKQTKEVKIVQYVEKKDKEGNVTERKEKVSNQVFDLPTLEEVKLQGDYFLEMAQALKLFLDKQITDQQSRAIVEAHKNNEGYKIQFENFYINFTKDLVKNVKETEKNIQEEKFQPNVIEPAFGLGRIITAVLEHNFKVRPEPVVEAKQEEVVEDKKAKKAKKENKGELVKPVRAYLTLPPRIAPIKCSILPLMSKEIFQETVIEVKKQLTRSGISNKVDESGVSIGKRYARTDELGIPFAITVDYETIEDGPKKGTLTFRELESTQQVRIPITDISNTINQLVGGNMLWKDVLAKYPLQDVKEE